MLSRKLAVRSASEPSAHVLRSGLRGNRVELAASPRQRAEEMIGALVAVGRELREALVDHGQAAVDLGNHALRRAFLLGDVARQSGERRIGVVDVECQCLGGVGSGLAHSGRRLLDQRRDSGGLGVDARADAVERRRGAFEKRFERAVNRRFRFTDLLRRRFAGAVDFRQPRRQPIGRFGNDPVGFGRALGEGVDLLAEFACPSPRIRRRSAQLLRNALRALLGPRQVLEQDGDVVPRGFCCAIQRLAVTRQPFALESNSRVMPPSLPVASSPSCIRCWVIIVSSVWLSLIRCDSTSSSASSDRASLRIVTTDWVNRSASLRRVRPNISHASPSRASGPAATATHCAISGEDSGCPPATGRPTRR